MNKQKIKDIAIVTGGLGFIGSHLVDLLIDLNFKVIVLDNESTGRVSNLKEHLSNTNNNYKNYNNENLEIINVDISVLENIQKLYLSTRYPNIKYIFHLAGLADIVPSIERPLDYHNTNVNGTLNILTLANDLRSKSTAFKKFVYAASSSCYGLSKDSSVEFRATREDDKIDPQYPYALSKNIGEQYVLHFGKIYKLPVVSLRLFNVFGTRSRTTGAYGAVLGIFLKQKLEKKPFTVVGDGNQCRDFIYVTDVASAFFAAASSDVSNEVFNVGSGNTYSINLLVELLAGEKIFLPKRPAEPDKTHADISKIKKMLNWRPQITFEEGVGKVLQNIHYWQDAPLWDQHSIANATANWFKHLS
ncbi:MAG: GDP-mannose 4,6-dehydratase [Oligoflexia bacterium]|nr:GDP-mannose 4,6-dehydratase [Oligoflexia bacterium]